MTLQTVGMAVTAVAPFGPRAAHTMATEAADFDRSLPGAAWHHPAHEQRLPSGHAVASGDPLADRVILWTRITIPAARGCRPALPTTGGGAAAGLAALAAAGLLRLRTRRTSR